MIKNEEDAHGEVTSFGALCTALSATIGTGNIVGVATAVCTGGPGALFWMWVVAFLGASSAFVESTLGQVFKVNIDGEYRGGPAYYIEKGLHSKPFAVLFAVVTVLAAGFLCPGVQGNSITSAFTHAFGLNTAVTTVFVISLLCFIIFGGITRIAQFTVVVVPFMAQIYIVAALIIVGVNIDKFPAMLQLVFSSAFGVNSMFGAMLGSPGPMAIFTELGRFMLAPHGHLIATVLHQKHIYKEYIGLDACAANLMRPAMYGAYHHITVLGKEHALLDHVYDITGGLCENNDKFAVDRSMPAMEIGDLVAIHDTGAHGFSMGYNYNGKLRSAEVLLHPDGSWTQIRRAETPADYFATLDCTPFHFEREKR